MSIHKQCELTSYITSKVVKKFVIILQSSYLEVITIYFIQRIRKIYHCIALVA